MINVYSFFNIDAFYRCITFAVFILAGYDLSKSVPRPKSIYSWIALAIAATLTGYLGTRVGLVMILGFEVYLNLVLLGFCCGFIGGFVVRTLPRFKIR